MVVFLCHRVQTFLIIYDVVHLWSPCSYLSLMFTNIFSEISQITSNHSNLSNQVHAEGQQMQTRNLMKKLNREPITQYVSPSEETLSN